MIGKVFSQYKIIKEIGHGGMGNVYLAEDTKLNRHVALKFLTPELMRDAEAKERFLREARAASSLDNPNICTIHEINETKDGQLFICMTYYEGESLKDKIKHGPIEPEEAIEFILQICQGLKTAHKNGLIHRDIKPANILITREGIVKIVDFGLAKLVDQTRITKDKTTMGTVAYLSPEQASGGEVNHKTDIWALGVILYEMCTNKLPFDQEYDAAIIYAIIDKTPEPPAVIQPGIPKELEKIIFRCLRKKVEDRYSSVDELIKDLIRVKNSIGIQLSSNDRIKTESKRETERRMSTIVFAEIPEYNELQNTLDDEEVGSIMNECLELFRKISDTHFGILKRISANNFMILFGVPHAKEDTPKQAINFSIKLRNRLSDFNKNRESTMPLSIKIGINTGKALVDEMILDNKREYSVIGDTVDHASMLKDIATKGQIYIGAETYRYTKNDFDFRLIKPVLKEGKHKGITVYELLSEKEKIYRKVHGMERMIYSEIIGREKELDKIQYHVLKLINGEGSILSIIGEAGIGKSRLIAELRQKEEIKKVRLAEGRALAVGKNLAFHPVIEIIKQLAGITEEDNETESLHKIEENIRQVYPEGLSEILPFIATLIGMKLSGKYAERIKGIEGEALEKLILKNLKDYLIKNAQSKPLIFIVEDLHWADLSSVELLESLYRLTEKHCILFINVFRPDYPETSDRILATIKDRYSKYHTEMFLNPLTDEHAETLINTLLKIEALPPKFNAQIRERAEGNPFYIEEIVRSFIDAGLIVFENGKFIVAKKSKSIIIPETINELLLTRIDNLDESNRTLLKIASVIGRHFFYKILAVLAENIEQIDGKLAYLQETQLILKGQRMAEVEYLFKHALVQQAVYSTLLVKQRKQLHAKVAQAIETTFHDRMPEFYGTLAFHYSIAEDPDKAEYYLVLAGEQALKSSASNEAINYYKQALSIYKMKYGQSADMKKVAMLEKYIGTALFNKGQYIDAAVYFDRVLDYYGMKLSKNPVISTLKFFYGLISLIVKIYFPVLMGKRIPTKEEAEIHEIIKYKNMSLTVTDARRYVIELISYSIWYTKFSVRKFDMLLYASGVFIYGGISAKIGLKIIDYYGKHYDKDDPKALLDFIVMCNNGNLLTGNWKDEYYDEKIMKLRMQYIGDIFITATYVAFLAHIHLERGDRKAEVILDLLSEIYEIYENDYAKLANFSHGTLYLYKFRILREALEKVNNGISFTQKNMGNKPALLMLYSLKIKVQVLLDDISGAEVTLKTAEEYVSADTFAPYFLSYYLTSRFCYLLYQLEDHFKSGNKHQLKKMRKCCLKSGKQAVKISRKAAYERCENYRMMGIYYWLTGKTKKALKWWGKSIREAEDLGARLELSHTYMEVGKRLSEKDRKNPELDGKNAEWYLNKAEELFTEMDLEWDMKKLEKIRSGLAKRD